MAKPYGPLAAALSGLAATEELKPAVSSPKEKGGAHCGPDGLLLLSATRLKQEEI